MTERKQAAVVRPEGVGTETKATLYYGVGAKSVLPTIGPGSVHCIVAGLPPFAVRDYSVFDEWWLSGTRGKFGQERTPDEYIRNVLEFVVLMLRLLRPGGCLWLDVIDCTVIGKKGFTPYDGTSQFLRDGDQHHIPHRLVLKLQSEGLWVRAIPRPKWDSTPTTPSVPMSRRFSYLLLVRHADVPRTEQYRNPVRVRLPTAAGTQGGSGNLVRTKLQPQERSDMGTSVPWAYTETRGFRDSDMAFSGFDDEIRWHETRLEWLRHLRGPRPQQGFLMDGDGDPSWALFKTASVGGLHDLWPPTMIQHVIRYSTSEAGACSKCGAQWIRPFRRGLAPYEWPVVPNCSCRANPVPPLVLDPFAGVAVAGVAATQSNCDFIGIEGSTDPEFLNLASRFITCGRVFPPRKEEPGLNEPSVFDFFGDR